MKEMTQEQKNKIIDMTDDNNKFYIDDIVHYKITEYGSIFAYTNYLSQHPEGFIFYPIDNWGVYSAYYSDIVFDNIDDLVFLGYVETKYVDEIVEQLRNKFKGDDYV